MKLIYDNEVNPMIEIYLSKNNINMSTNMYIVHRALVQQLHEKRQGNANSKTRSEVRGGGKKPWKQKGTGRARVGSIRSPLWRGGGTIFGPKTKNYSKKINKKEKRLAIRSILWNKKDYIHIIEDNSLSCNKPNTKLLISKINQLNINIKDKILIILTSYSLNTYLSIRNISHINLIDANHINTVALINTKYIIMEKSAINTLTQM